MVPVSDMCAVGRFKQLDQSYYLKVLFTNNEYDFAFLISSFSFNFINRMSKPTNENCGKRVSHQIIKILQFLFYNFKILFTNLENFARKKSEIKLFLEYIVRNPEL